MWNNLTLKEKAELIQAGVKAGYRDIDSIREIFNSFSKGNYQEPIIQRTQEQLPVENVESSEYSVVPKLDYYKDPNEERVNKFDGGGRRLINKFPFGGLVSEYDIPPELRSPDSMDQNRYYFNKNKEEQEAERRRTLVKNIASFIPFIGTRISYDEFTKDPTIGNGLNFGVDLITDFATPLKFAGKGVVLEAGLVNDMLNIDTSNGMGLFVPFGGEPKSMPLSQQVNPYVTNKELHKTPEEKQAEQEVNNKVKQIFQLNDGISKISENAVWNQPPSNSTTSFRVGMPSWKQQQKWKANKSKKK